MISTGDRERALALLGALVRDPEEIRFIAIEGQPFSKARPRFTYGGRGHVYTYNAKEQRDNEARIRERLRSLCPTPSTGTLAVVCLFFRKSRTRIDVDNLVKQVLDAGNGVVWVDDMQVTAQIGVLELDADNPRTLIAIAPHATTMQRLTHAQRECLRCGAVFKPSLNASKYCSRTCSGQGVPKPIPLANATCPTCRTGFVRRRAQQRYCSDRCKMSALKGSGPKKQPPLCDTCGTRVSRREYRRCWRCFQRQAFGREPGTVRVEVSAAQ